MQARLSIGIILHDWLHGTVINGQVCVLRMTEGVLNWYSVYSVEPFPWYYFLAVAVF
jgi:hypothetical protein